MLSKPAWGSTFPNKHVTIGGRLHAQGLYARAVPSWGRSDASQSLVAYRCLHILRCALRRYGAHRVRWHVPVRMLFMGALWATMWSMLSYDTKRLGRWGFHPTSHNHAMVAASGPATVFQLALPLSHLVWISYIEV